MTSTSWRALPGGHLVGLNRTQELLLDIVPVLEDLGVAVAQLECVQVEAARTQTEARALIVRSRRQRLGLRLLDRADTA